MNKLKLQNLAVAGKKVLLRVDFNVPLDGETITDDTKIKESLHTIQYILKQGGSVIILSHLGRPEKKDPTLSLRPCAMRLCELLRQPVGFVDDCLGPEVRRRANGLKKGEVLVLENVRFHPEEEKGDPHFAKELANLGEVYVNDAFGSAHRAHASTAIIAQFFPGRAAEGLLMQKEITFLNLLIHYPKRPFYAIIGGAKVSTKIGVLKALTKKVDGIFIGGAIGLTLYGSDQLNFAKIPIYLPEDVVIAKGKMHKTIDIKKGIPKGWAGMDIGPKTLANWKKILKGAATVFWNGPVGVFEKPAFAHGTEGVAKALAELKATTIVGGGDSLAAINQLGLDSKFTHLSTGGGASLEFIELGGHLPGIDALSNNG